MAEFDNRYSESTHAPHSAAKHSVKNALSTLITKRVGGSGKESVTSDWRNHNLKTVPNSDEPSEVLTVASDSFTFFAIGDFGEPTTDVISTALLMGNFPVHPEFILGLGDNFYPAGVRSADDEQFQSNWYDIFLRPFPQMQVPWFNALGNHDYRGDAMAQIDFHYHPNNIGRFWRLPAMNYSFSVEFGSNLETSKNTIEFFELDTNGVQHSVRDTYPETKELLRQFIDDLDAKLSQSTARWKIVYGHHPMYTKGLKHGILGRNLAQQHSVDKFGVECAGYGLEDLLVRHGVDAYISGHEHKMQYHYHRGIHNFVAGAAGHSNRFYGGADPDTQLSWVDDCSLNGFLQVEVCVERLICRFIATNNEVVKEVVIEK